MESMTAAGYVDICHDDRLAALSPNHRIGLLRNSIPHLVKRMGDKTFGEWSQKGKANTAI